MFDSSKSVCRSRRVQKAVGCATVACCLAAGSLHFASSASAATTVDIKIPKKCGPAYDGVTFKVPNNWRAKVINEAIEYCGTPYKWGGTSKSGIDCSGLVMKAFRVNGKDPFKIHRANTQIRTKGLVLRDAQNGNGKTKAVGGDLVAYSSDGGDFYHHIGIYLGWSGDKRVFIHAPRTGQDVKVSTVGTGEYEVFKNPDSLMD